jgi:shikimate dehydrogenase
VKRAGVIGYPLTHTISPAILQAAFDAAGIEATYEAWPAEADQLEGRVNALRHDDMLGANVTIPHKEAIIPLLDSLDEGTEEIGAVNTVAHRDGNLIGYNTDVPGFMRALREDAGFEPKGKHTAIIGAGGAARAVAYALVKVGASVVLLAGRSPRRLDGVVVAMRKLTETGTTVTWCHWLDGVFMQEIPKSDLLVNCTPVGTRGSDTEGQSPMPVEFMPANGLVFDLLYNPAETQLLRDAKSRGLKAMSGLGMLVYQAAESFRIWTGKDAAIDKMMSAAKGALGE